MSFGVAEWNNLLEREMALEPEAQFAALVERQARFVFRVAYAVLRNTEDAEEAVQDTFFKLFRNASWKGIRDERAFLARVAWRIAIDKRPSRAEQAMDRLESESAAPSPEQTAIERDQQRIIRRLIDSLPEKMRHPLILFSTAGMTTAEIAKLLNTPEATVRRLLSEARALLKEKLARWEARKDG